VSVVANVAINLDARGVTERLKAIRQTSIGAADGFTKLSARAQAVKSIVEAQQGSFAKASTVQGVFAAKVKNTEFAIKAQIAALRDVQSKVQLNGALYQKAAAQIAQYEATLAKTTTTQDRSQKSLGGLRGALASIGAGALVASMVRGAAAAEQLQLRLKLLSGEYGETARIQQFVTQSAQTFGQSQLEASQGVADVYARLRPLGVSLDQIETIYKGFNATALASGTSAEAASGAFLQLSQALGSGTLQGDEFRSVAEQVPGILRLVAGEMGVTVGELKKLGSEGKITSDVLINALAKGFDENSSKIKTLLDQSPAQRFKEFKDSTQALSNALGSELLPALVPIVKTATELLRLFGSLPGPVKTLIAAVFGLTAAFVALAPAISTAISLLGGLSIATLAAAGPWVALAAGITAAAVALAGYRSEAQKVAGAAKTGTAVDVVAARNLSVQKGQEISMLERQRKTASGPERAQIDRRLGRLRTDQSELQSAITASTADRPAAAVLPPAVTGGGAGAATSAGGGAGKASNEAEKLAKELERSLELGDRLGTEFSRQVLLLGEASEIEQKRLQIQFDYEDRAKQIAELKNTEQQTNLSQLNDEIRRKKIIDLQTEALKKQAEEADKLFKKAMEGAEFGAAGEGTVASGLSDAISQLKEDLNPIKLATDSIVGGANAIGNAFGQAFQDVATGAKSTQEALGDAFESIGKAFISMAAEIIAKQMTLIILQTIFNALSGGSSALGTANKNLSGTGALKTTIPGFAVGARAMGGPVSSNQPYIVGERGPELFVPGVSGSVVSNADTRAALAQQATNRQGNDTRAMLEQQATNRQMNAGGNAMQQKPIEVKYESTVINGVEYVTAEQHQRGITLAAERGRALTLQTLQNSVKTRKRVGMA
jgi:tape measure domain-containing protein